MKIGRDPTGINTTGSVKSSAKPTRPTSKSGRANSLHTEDEVSLTAHALQMRMLEELAEKAPVVDAERVEEIRQAIIEGRLKVDSEAIASKLLAAVHELAVKAKR